MGVAADQLSGPAAAEAKLAVGAADLAELMAAFNGVTARLQETHESLQNEVVRLRRELHEANEQLERSRRLAALGEMAAGIAHEVRNPLGSIRLYARMLEEDLTDRPDQRRVATKIAAAVRGLDAVVGDVLAFAREVRVRPSMHDAGDLLSHAMEACCPNGIAPAGVRVVRRDADRAGIAVHCDAGLTHQALVNVIRNALQAMADLPDREHVLTIDAEPRAAAGPDGRVRPMVALIVSDTGPGIGPEALERMFNPFFTTRHTGTGLGLAIVHRIVDAHGGRIAVRSEPERGAEFELMFPMEEAEPA